MLFSLRRLFIAVVLLAATTMLPLTASALYDELVRDFKPVSGIVIMPIKNEFLIDLDASRGITVGDVFAVVQPGEPIIHPETKQVIGSLDEVKGFLQVTRVKSGYSYAHPLGNSSQIVARDAIRRYENLPAIFLDQTGKGEETYAKVKQAIPALEWQGYIAGTELPSPATESTTLTFVLKPGVLEVRDPGFNVLRTYPVTTTVMTAAPTAVASAATLPPATAIVTAAQPSLPAPMGPAIVAAPAQTGAVVGNFSPAIIRQNLAEAERGVWVSPAVKEALVGVEVGEMDGDGKLETALLYAHRIEIVRMAGGAYESVAQVDLGAARKALAVDGADLDGNGVMELYITAAFDKSLSSMIVSLGTDGYKVRKTNIDYYFRNVDLPSEGPVLLAQRMGDNNQDFAGPIFRVRWNGGEIQPGAELEVPKTIRLFSFIPVPETDSSGESLVYLTPLDRLQIYSSSGEKVWDSSDHYGGSEEFITRIDPMKAPQDGDNTRDAYMQARLGRGDAGEILIPVNEGDWFRARSKTFRKSKLMAMVWNGRELLEAWHTREQNGYLADFRMSDVDNDGQKEIVMAINGSSSGLLGNRRSSLYVFEMQ